MRNSAQSVLADQAKVLEELLAQKTSSSLLLNATIETGEKLYPSTSAEGREIIRTQLEELQQAFDSIFDDISVADRDLKSKLNVWSEFDNSLETIQRWSKDVEKLLPTDIELRATLEEKKAQLQVYRNLLHDVSAHQQNIVDLRNKVAHLPDTGSQFEGQIATVSEQHAKLQKRAQNFVERYEKFVADHQKFDKAMLETTEWIEAKESSVGLWADTTLERVSLLTNLERLKVTF